MLVADIKLLKDLMRDSLYFVTSNRRTACTNQIHQVASLFMSFAKFCGLVLFLNTAHSFNSSRMLIIFEDGSDLWKSIPNSLLKHGQ